MAATLISQRARSLAPSIIREMVARRKPTTLDLTLGQPSLPPDPEVLEAAHRRLTEHGHGYTENAGLVDVRAAVASYHAFPDRGGPEHVVLTAGSIQGLYLALTAAVDVGDEVLIPETGFPAYPGIVDLVGAKPVLYPIDHATGLIPRAEALAARVTPRTRAVILNDPANPFGTVIPSDELDRLAELIDRYQLVAITDEIYRDLRYDGLSPDSVAVRTPRAVFVGGLSKSCALTGHRIGYLIGDEELMGRATLVNQLMITCAPRPAQYVAQEYFRRPELLRAHVPFYLEARAALREGAEQLPDPGALHLGDGAFYAVLDVSKYAGGDASALAMALLDEQDVAVVPGAAFGPGGQWFWRMSYAGGAKIAGEGLARIAAFLLAR